MRTILRLIHGESPHPAGVILTWLLGFLAAAATWREGPDGLAGALLALLALDWTGGVVANATRATRAAWATLSRTAAVAFLAAHLLEVPILLLLTSSTPHLRGLVIILLLKLAVFAVGQIELRRPETIITEGERP